MMAGDLRYTESTMKETKTKPEALDDSTFKWIDRMARLMDDEFSIPGTRFRFGLDPLLNLVPFAGNGFTVLVSALLVIAMHKFGVSGKVVVKMMGNIAIDGIIGAIPLIGNIFDFYYKSNTKNVELLKSHYAEGKHQGSGLGLIIITLLIILGVLGLIIYAGIWILNEVLQAVM